MVWLGFWLGILGVIWLVLYFAFNLGLTLYNKSVLSEFPYPYTLTALHAFCGILGSLGCMNWRLFVSFILGCLLRFFLSVY